MVQTVFSVLFVAFGTQGLDDGMPWLLVVVLAVVWLVLEIPVSELTKRQDRKRFEKDQKRLKLLFNTKLGMHSPV